MFNCHILLLRLAASQTRDQCLIFQWQLSRHTGEVWRRGDNTSMPPPPGGVFNGAPAVASGEDLPLIETVRLAKAAAAISVNRLGAQSSAPYWKEIEALPARTKIARRPGAGAGGVGQGRCLAQSVSSGALPGPANFA